MLRHVLLGLLVVSASACGKSTTESAAKVQPGVAAGKVLEVKGAVTVKHGADTKPLAVGDSVEGDDTVVTGADGNVVIELAHNSARWELGANKSQRVRDSIAWNAKKATAQEIDQATAAAGRPAERSAAGTVAMEGEAAMAEPAPAAPSAAPAAPPAEESVKADDMSPKGGEAPKPPPRRRMASKSASTAAPEAAMAPAPPPPPAPEPTADDEVRPARTRGPIAKSAPPQAPMTESAKATAAAPAPSAAPPPTPTQQLKAKAAALQKCMADHGAKDEVTLVVDVAGGTSKLTSKSAVSAGLQKCVEGVVSGISFVLTGKGTLVLKP